MIFESSDYGNVLVLDNVIQCTERDEFAYQEMITNLAMNSHPCPKKVLVIGGGDGGVLREVVKHECVEEAILCDIDEAVIRLSKQYLPHMAAGFASPKATVYVGDGFKFLADYKNTFDVIITDSSDPEGPAAALFQKAYFELLHGALKVRPPPAPAPLRPKLTALAARRRVVSSPRKVVSTPLCFPVRCALSFCQPVCFRHCPGGAARPRLCLRYPLVFAAGCRVSRGPRARTRRKEKEPETETDQESTHTAARVVCIVQSAYRRVFPSSVHFRSSPARAVHPAPCFARARRRPRRPRAPPFPPPRSSPR